MKTELIVIENDVDLAEATALVNALMASVDAPGTARLRAQARLVEDYELQRWPREVPSAAQLLADLMYHAGEETSVPRGVMDWLSGLRTRAQARADGQAQTDSADLIREARDSRALITRLAGQTPVGQDLPARDERYDMDQPGASLPDALAHPASADIDFDPPPLELMINAHEPTRRHWNYRLLRHSDGCLAIHEVYYNAEGHPKSVTERPVGIVGDDVEEVRRVLEMMARSLGEPVLDYESFKNEGI